MISDTSSVEERINSCDTGSITSFQAIYIPADDITDEAVQTILSHMDGQIVLNRKVAEQGLYPAVDVSRSSSSLIDADIIGARHYNLVSHVLASFARYDELEEIIAVLGIDELSEADKIFSIVPVNYVIILHNLCLLPKTTLIFLDKWLISVLF